MKLQFRMSHKEYVHLITYVSSLDTKDFDISYVDQVNVRTLYVDMRNKFERWRINQYYHLGMKHNSISMELNLFDTIQRIGLQIKIDNYETNLLHIMWLQAEPQIKHYFFINQSTLNMLP